MSLLGNFHFIRPTWLLLLAVVVWLWWTWRQSSDSLRGWRAVMDSELLVAMTVGKENCTNWPANAILVSWVLGVIAVAGPTWRPEPSLFAKVSAPVILVLKADESMSMSDFSPSRMERARLKVVDFTKECTGVPLGLITYAGSSHLVLPPTRDTAVMEEMVAAISPEIMPKTGDDLVSALNLAIKSMDNSNGSIVVLVDSVSAGNESSLRMLRQNNLAQIYFLAIARPDTPELESVKNAASVLRADVMLLTPDLNDVKSLVRKTAGTPASTTGTEEGERWSEAGWWLVPLIALLSLIPFRRENTMLGEDES